MRSRPRSEFEIRKRLKLKGYGNDVIDDVVEGLRRIGDINDEKFAAFWLESRMHMNPAGDALLRRELKEKGVNEVVIEAALAEKAKTYDEHAVALRMAEEKFSRLKKLDRKKAAKRLYDLLMRRGFKYDTVRDIIEELTRQGNDL